MRNFVRKCSCGKCSYCYEHERYLRNKSEFIRRANLRHLRVKESKEDLRSVLRDFNDRVISVDELLVILDG